VSYATTLEAYGNDTFILDLLKLIADANLGGQGLIKIYLHTESSISASLVIHSVGIDLQ
jgi:hypothetical protein